MSKKNRNQKKENVRVVTIKGKEAQALERDLKISDALKVAGVIVGVGLAAGTALVLGLNKLMKDVFVSEDWPDEEWSSDDWADEELDD